MEVLAIVCLCLTFSLATSKAAAGLECYSCGSVYSESTDGAVTALLSGFTRSEACETAENPSALELATCPTTSPEGYVYACQKLSGEASGTVAGVDFTLTGIFRGCMQVKTADNNDCKETTDTSPFGLGVALTGEGIICNCDSAKCNGQTNLTPALVAFLVNVAIALYLSF